MLVGVAMLVVVPVVVAMVLPVPPDVMVPPPVALRPLPVVVSMSRPPPVRLIVGLDPLEENAAPVPVSSFLVAPEKLKVPPLLVDM